MDELIHSMVDKRRGMGRGDSAGSAGSTGEAGGKALRGIDNQAIASPRAGGQGGR